MGLRGRRERGTASAAPPRGKPGGAALPAPWFASGFGGFVVVLEDGDGGKMKVRGVVLTTLGAMNHLDDEEAELRFDFLLEGGAE